MKYIFLFIYFIPFAIISQANILNAKSPDEIGVKGLYEEVSSDRGPLEYEFVDDKDVLFSKTIWEVISLDERVNFPLYYPIDTMAVGNERRPLIHYLYTSVLSGEIDIYEKDNLKDKKPIDKLKKQLVYRIIEEGDSDDPIGEERISSQGGRIKFIQSYNIIVPDSLIQFEIDYDNGYYENDPEVGTKQQNWKNALNDIIFENNLLSGNEYRIERFEYADVIDYRLKGIWYFDKRIGELRYRPIAISPIIPSQQAKAEDKVDEESKHFEMFWIFYPDARQILHEGLAFDNKNTSKQISFDHLINSRRFSAFIYKEDNVFEDRDIKGYIPENALMQLLESERIKEKIRNLEQDMWSY